MSATSWLKLNSFTRFNSSTTVQLSGGVLQHLATPQDHVRLPGLMGDLHRTASQLLAVNHRPIDTGRHQILSPAEIANVAADPALAWLSLEPVIGIDNNVAVGHMRADDVSNYFVVGLNGSGHSITVADSGIDRDHGDFNGRIQHVESVIWGDSSTEDEHSVTATHVACTVLAPAAEVGMLELPLKLPYALQVMEDDSSVSGGVSMDTLGSAKDTRGIQAFTPIHGGRMGTMGSTRPAAKIPIAEPVEINFIVR